MLDRFDTKNFKNSAFLSILHSRPLSVSRKPKLKIGDGVRISRCDLHFTKCYMAQFTRKVYEIVAISSKNLQNTINDEQDEIFRGKVYQKK